MNDPRWKIVDEVHEIVSLITDAAIKTRKLELWTEEQAMDALKEASSLMEEAAYLRDQILADGMAAMRAIDPVRWP